MCADRSYQPCPSDTPLAFLCCQCLAAPQQVFLIKYPPQADVRPPAPVQSAAGFTLSSEEFAELHPFHLLLDKDCRLLQVWPTVKVVGFSDAAYSSIDVALTYNTGAASASSHCMQ
jgi:hypothetical protein